MNNVPPSVRAALKRRGADAILNQEGDYSNFKAEIDRIIHGDNQPMNNIVNEDYDEEYEESLSSEEQRATERIDELGEKYKPTEKDEFTSMENKLKNKLGNYGKDINISDLDEENGYMRFTMSGDIPPEVVKKELNKIGLNDYSKILTSTGWQIDVNLNKDKNKNFLSTDNILDEYGLVKDEKILKEAGNKLMNKFGGLKEVDSMSNEEFKKYATYLQNEYGIEKLEDAEDMLIQIDEYLDETSEGLSQAGYGGAAFDKELKQDLYEELADNEYIYGNLNKDQVAQVLSERKGIDLNKAKEYVDKNFNENFWDEDMFDDEENEYAIENDDGTVSFNGQTFSSEEDFVETYGENAKKYIKQSEENEKPQSNWYDNLSDESEHAKAYKEDAMKVDPERAALIAAAMDEYIAEKPQRGWITEEQLKKYGERLGLPQMSDRDLRLMWDDVHNVGSYRSFGTPYDKGGRELEDAQSAFAEVVNQEARNRKAKGNYFPYNEEDIEGGKNKIRDILSRLDGYDLDDSRDYLTGRELMQIEDIADKYHLTTDDLAKISHHLDPNGMGYKVKGWISPETIKKEKENEDEKLRDYLSKSNLGLSKDLIDELVKYVRDKKDN